MGQRFSVWLFLECIFFFIILSSFFYVQNPQNIELEVKVKYPTLCLYDDLFFQYNAIYTSICSDLNVRACASFEVVGTPAQ